MLQSDLSRLLRLSPTEIIKKEKFRNTEQKQSWLSNKNSCLVDSINDLDSTLTDLTSFSNIQHVFICKIPPRLDLHNINNKVSEFNSLLSERFSDTEEHISVVDTILPEFRCSYVDGLHFSHFGLKKVCSITLSNLYKVLAPSKHYKRKSSLKYSRPALIIPTIALQSVLKIIRLSYQASLRMAELHCFGKSALMIWLNL